MDTSVARSLLEDKPPPLHYPLAEMEDITNNLSLPLHLSPQQISSSITTDQFISTYMVVKERVPRPPSLGGTWGITKQS